MGGVIPGEMHLRERKSPREQKDCPSKGPENTQPVLRLSQQEAGSPTPLELRREAFSTAKSFHLPTKENPKEPYCHATSDSCSIVSCAQKDVTLGVKLKMMSHKE